MASKQDYKQQHEEFLRSIAQETDVKSLSCGVLYKVLQSGIGVSPKINSVVGVYYRGMLISGKVFDDNTAQGYPDAFRLSDLIKGWQVALTQMKVGDRWIIYLPSEMGYGKRGTDGIPCNSTLIFEIELVSVS